MKILIIDTVKIALSVALRMEEAGHQVKMYIPPDRGGEPNHAGDGLITKVPQWEPSMKWADLIILTDNNTYINALEPYFKQGLPILGCNRAAGELELDREKGQEIMKEYGIKVPPFEKFTSYNKAIEFVRKTGKTYVAKPIGDADKGLSYVSKSPADMIFKLQRWSKSNPLKKGFVLQECVKGTEMAVGGWFGPGGWSKWRCENWEEKRLMNDGLGINTGEQGTTLRYVSGSKLFDEVVEPVSDYLFDIDYCGYVDVNCIIDEGGIPLPLEFTMRLGWPMTIIQMALHQGDPAKWMLDLISGKDTLKVDESVAVGVVMSHGDYPYNFYSASENSGYPIVGITSKNKDQVHLVEVAEGLAPVMKGSVVADDRTLVTTGNYVLLATGTGPSVNAAIESCYDVLWGVDLPSNRMFRTDIGKRLEEEIPELQKHGFAKGLKF